MIQPRRSATSISFGALGLLLIGVILLWMCFKAAVIIFSDPSSFMQ